MVREFNVVSANHGISQRSIIIRTNAVDVIGVEKQAII